eukprot:1795946-Pyramimonas_sp.AAC.1
MANRTAAQRPPGRAALGRGGGSNAGRRARGAKFGGPRNFRNASSQGILEAQRHVRAVKCVTAFIP